MCHLFCSTNMKRKRKSTNSTPIKQKYNPDLRVVGGASQETLIYNTWTQARQVDIKWQKC